MVKKVALVTGGAHRIGAAISKFLHAQGMSVVIHCNTAISEAEQLAAQFNAQRENSSFVIHADLCQLDQHVKILEAISSHFGRLDVLVHNASVFYPTMIEQVTSDTWENLFTINLKAPFFLTQAALPLLSESRGCIVNITDIHAQKPLKCYSVYSIGQAGLKMMTEALAKELAPSVRVNAVAPGAILWPEKQMDLSLQKRIIYKIALKRQGNPIDIAKAVWFLIDSPYITGQTVVVDGGRLMD
jgi:pteridine reductase